MVAKNEKSREVKFVCELCGAKVKGESLSLGSVGERKCDVCGVVVNSEHNKYYFFYEDVLNKFIKPKSREVDVVDIPGQLRLIRIFDKEKAKTPIGFALVSMDKGLEVLWYINIDKRFRKQKFASDIILAMQNSFDRIETLHESEEGRLLCLKNGFEVVITKHTKDKVLPMLVWTSKKDKK